MATQRSAREYLHGEQGVVVVVPARVARWLAERVDLNRLRVAVRGDDPEVYEVLAALHLAALHEERRRSTSGTGSENFRRRDGSAEVQSVSESMSATEAAEVLDLSDRAVRLACEQRRLPGEKVDGRWRLRRIDVEQLAAGRAG